MQKGNLHGLITNLLTITSCFGVQFNTQPIFSLDAFARWRQGIAQADLSQSKSLINSLSPSIKVFRFEHPIRLTAGDILTPI